MATITSLSALPDGAGVFSQGNHDQINTNVSRQNTNNTNINAALATAITVPVTSAQINPAVIQEITVPLTLAQVLATNSAPPVLIAAQGAGTLIDVISMTFDSIRGSAAYVGGGAVAGYLGTDSTGVLATAIIAATFFTTFAASQAIKVAGALAVAATSTILNKALVLANPTADFTVGTGATAIVKISFRVLTGLS
jgi:hypothetical protein